MASLNASFLIALCGPSHSRYRSALEYLRSSKNAEVGCGHVALFYNEGLRWISEEIRELCDSDPSFKKRLRELSRSLGKDDGSFVPLHTIEKVWKIFFPEGVQIFQQKQRAIEFLRKKRAVDIVSLNKNPLKDTAAELLITSNVLVTLPSSVQGKTDGDIPLSLTEKLKAIKEKPQRYWYDHPTWIGEKYEKSEVVYGLRGLDRAVAFEKSRGTIGPEDKMRCILSISVTHDGLEDLTKEWLYTLFEGAGGFENLLVYAFSERDTERIIDEILDPIALKLYGKSVRKELRSIFGVNGQYGRHYSFLKAIAVFWQVILDPAIKATFKIDLDQVFPQDRLVRETGRSAFEHFMTPLWGAEGIDSKGKKVKLGMLAGALVNHDDIDKSLFTPDIKFPKAGDIRPDEWFFFSRLPQAVSTEAEMMKRYGGEPIDGQNKCIQRVHVTGGTCGILVESLKHFMPFTPSFIGRAEDQAYLLSVLCDERDAGLRYFHADGLIMRHDKEAFAKEAIRAASTGKLIGDYERILLFSKYADALAQDITEIKEFVDPFTGCFISRIPLNVVFRGFAMKGASFFEQGMISEGIDFIDTGSSRLLDCINNYVRASEKVEDIYMKEKQAWKKFYTILEFMENSLLEGDNFALNLRERSEEIIMESALIP